MQTATDYSAFLQTKGHRVEVAGFEPTPLHPMLYPFQADIVRWAVRNGRAAIFADCGMGKSFMQVEWARQIHEHTGGPVLLVAPIAVGQQTINEAAKLGVEVRRVAAPEPAGIQITNYEQLHKFVGAEYAGIVLDESSILKSMDGKTRTLLIQKFSAIPYRLCCTATPAPNDVSELANHAEFLGAMSRVEMLATFFVHDSDDGEWRMKGHAAGDMWRWAQQWARFVRRPSDLGYSDDGFVLPSLTMHEELVPTGLQGEQSGISTRAQVRRSTLSARVQRALELLGCTTQRIDEPSTSGTATGTSLRPESGSGATASATTQPTAPGSEPTESASASLSAGAGTDSLSKLSRRCLGDRTGDAQSVVAALREEPLCTSTTTTEPGSSEGCSASCAITDSGSSAMTRYCSTGQEITSSNTPWIVWCGLNDEEDALKAALGDRCVVVNGRDSEETRLAKLERWRSGESPVLVTKAKIFGWGINFQNCARMMFFGIGDSFELFYQAVRRCWRFGQTRPVDVYLVVSDIEGSILENVKRKEEEAHRMAESIVAAVRETQTGAVRTEREDKYEPKMESGEKWDLLLGDSCERVREVPDACVGFSVYSPPFASLYTYSSSRRDLGNSKSFEEFFAHYSYLIPELLRVTMPGRRTAVHCQQLSTTKATHGHIGWRDFRGELIRAYVAAGWIYDGEVCIDKNPQAQAIRTKSKQLMFVQKEKDSSWLRPAMADYILLFRHPGENTVPVKTDVTNEEWILFAHPIWYGIRESDVLKYRDAREDEDEKHICPLQLETIERCIRLWSNPGEVVLSPFAGIGSEGYVARRFGRQFIGIELKESYWRQAVTNLRRADQEGIAQPTEAVGKPAPKVA